MSNIPFFPHDIIIEIILRLPVKSQIKFRCVSKTWNFLISSHDFSKTHLRYLKSHSNYFKHRILLASDRYGVFFKKITIHSLLFKGLDFVATHVEQLTDIEFVGSCNGLLCIATVTRKYFDRTCIVIWNPAIRKTRWLPHFGYESGYEKFCSYGFGFDESCDDYKVVAFYFGCRDKWDVIVKIFSLKTGEMKKIKNHNGSWTTNHPPSFANNKLHWLAATKHEQKLFIAYLDLPTEEYGILVKPDSVVLSQHSLIKALSGGSLYVICCVDGVTNVWLVKPGYGIGTTTWSKVYRFNYPKAYQRYKDLLYVLNKGEIVFLYNGQIEIFNPSDRSVTFHGLGRAHYFRTGIAYVESLVSPFM